MKNLASLTAMGLLASPLAVASPTTTPKPSGPEAAPSQSLQIEAKADNRSSVYAIGSIFESAGLNPADPTPQPTPPPPTKMASGLSNYYGRTTTPPSSKARRNPGSV